MFLLDTVVISEGAKRRPAPPVVGWLEQQVPESLFLSVITVGEIARGIAGVRRHDPAFAMRLAAWLGDLQAGFAERILPLTIPVALRWGELAAALGTTNPDLQIAATALEHRLTVVTRNRRHFDGTGVAVFDPFQA